MLCLLTAFLEFVVYRDPTGCLTAFCFSPFEVRDDSNPSGDGLPHLNRIKLGGTATDLAEALGVQAYEERVHECAHPKAVPPRRPLMSRVNPIDEQIRICFREPESTVPGF